MLSRRNASVSHLPRKSVVFTASRPNFSRRSVSCQKRQTTGFGARILDPPQPPLPISGRSGSARPPLVVNARTTRPPKSPSPIAAKVLASANSKPSTPVVSTNIDGSITGEASQNAITADRGTPIASSAAMSGITPQEQNGESPPASAPSRIIRTGAPVKAFAMRLSAPVATAQAAIPMESKRYGAVFASEASVNSAEASACGGETIATASRSRPETSQTLCFFQRSAAGFCLGVVLRSVMSVLEISRWHWREAGCWRASRRNIPRSGRSQGRSRRRNSHG